jgi:hypothetical protein
MSDQFPRKNIENDRLMQMYDFHQIYDGWKCDHCNKKVEWKVKEAESHYYQKHAKLTFGGKC